MLKGTTKSGFAFEIGDDRCNNMELLDALADVDAGDAAQLSTVVRLLLPGDSRKALYEHLRTEKGNVPVDAVINEVREILESGSAGKNS